MIMKQYIDKTAITAEIKRRIILLENNSDGIISMLTSGMFVNEYKDLLSFLDTLEVKEVDCEREIGTYTTKELLQKRNKATNVFHLTQGDIDRIARHFFELGLKLKGE